jgi:PAS domain S-box-containing protein
MRLSLKIKLTLTTAVLVLAVVAVISALYVASLTRQVIRQVDDRARFLAELVFGQAQQALADAATGGKAPASLDPADVREYVRRALEDSNGLSTQLETPLGTWPLVYEITISDRQGIALVSSDPDLPGRPVPARADLGALVRGGFVPQFRRIFGRAQIYEYRLPFQLGREPYGDIRVAVSTTLLKNDIAPGLRRATQLGIAAVLLSTLVVAVLTFASLAPLARITAQLDRISRGEFDLPPVQRGDELGLVSNKINQIGQQLRGVREIFSNLRENLNQIMSGLEDGLLLFTGDGRAVLVSSSAQKFLGVEPSSLLGRRVSEIFPPEHPFRQGLRIEGDRLEPTENVEVQLDGTAEVRRVGASVQVISERGTGMGALVTLRDLDSLERLGSQLQVSERLAALGRVTAGVAHEVKNPLNSMRLWLENLKESLPADQELPAQAVKILDSEIDRLDRVVKTFLDFTRPVELRLETVKPQELLEEVVALARRQTEKIGVQVSSDFPAEVPPVRVDTQLIKQAILNLMLNACQAMRDGGRLTIALRRRGEMAEISVADTGSGVLPEHRGRIFELFFTTRPGGTGIGLATTFRIVQLHNGSIDFQSEVGRGTTFRIELPLAG